VTIRERTIGSQTILDIRGKVVQGDTTERLTDRVSALLAQERNNIVLNVARVSYCDNSAFKALVALGVAAKNNGGKLTLMQRTPWWKRILNRV
jgi:anti-anti-sigma factor